VGKNSTVWGHLKNIDADRQKLTRGEGCRVSGERVRLSSHVLEMEPRKRIPATPYHPDPRAQFAGLEALRSMAVHLPQERARPGQSSQYEAAHINVLHLFAMRAWRDRVRLVLFAVNGMNVFAIGLLIQVVLVKYAAMGHVSSYIVQTIASVQINFVLSRFLTWGDRDAAIMPALARFNLQQITVTGLGIMGYVGLEKFGINYITANVAITALLTPVSFLCSHKWSLKGKSRADKISRNIGSSDSTAKVSILSRRAKAVPVAAAGLVLVGAVLLYLRADMLQVILVTASAFNLLVASLDAHWRFYALRNADAINSLAWPEPIPCGRENISFTSIVCALDEAEVICTTLEGLIQQTHMRHQIVVSLRDHDFATIRAVRAFQRKHPGAIEVVIGDYALPGKYAQLNGALPHCRGDYIGPIDSEDDVAPELLAHVESLIRRTNADIVQGAVQLMNLGRSWREWFKVHNVEEYRVWYSSRMAFQVNAGFVPLGGNTVYIRASLLRAAGGWPESPTEDCAAGVLMCSRYGAKVVAAYSAELATREEVPGTLFNKEVGSLFWQRVRWLQGTFQELMQGTWLEMPAARQRLLAGYILATPILQAISCALIPLALATVFATKMPIGLTLFMFAPFIPMALTIASMLIGVHTFGRDYTQRVRIRHYASILFLTPVYQIILASAAITGVAKHLRNDKGWYKTSRLNEHRDSARFASLDRREAAA
jgi:cellulose synthase/poly-beta-1,6-N-acetylglucosamine synthase-like glycosyltransferase/putative flippase GtrA